MDITFSPKRLSARAFAATALAAVVAAAPATAQTGAEAPPAAAQTGAEAPPAAAQTGAEAPPPAAQTGAEAPPPAAQTGVETPPPAAQTGVEAPPPATQTGAETPPPAAQTGAEAPPPAVETPPPAAQTGVETPPPAVETPPPAARKGVEAPPPASSDSSSSYKAAVEHFVATAAPTAYFLATASRLALSNSRNSKLQKFAATMAKDQTEVANSLASWVNVNSAVVTSRSPYTGRIGRNTAKLASPNLLPSQVSDLHRLSPLQGKDFDAAYISTVMAVLVQLENLYSDYSKNGTEPGLLAIASRQSPKVEQAISDLDALDKENK